MKNRFRKEKLLTEYLRELTGLVIKNVKDRQAEWNTALLYNKLESYLCASE